MTTLLAPRYWGGHLLVVLAIAVTAGLGIWQLHAWREHRAQASQDLTAAKPVALTSVMTGDSPFPGTSVGRPVSMRGSWLRGTVYVEHRRHAGRDGFWVVSPLLVDGTRSAMPVVRGWSATASAPAVTGPAKITGWLQPGDDEGLDDPNGTDDVVPELSIPDLVQRVPADLFSGYVVARSQPSAASADLAEVRPPATPGVGWTTGLRNLFYAVEWWVFGGFAVVVWWRWCRDTLSPPSDREPASVAV